MTKRSNSEVGHAKNVANFEQLQVRCIGFGAQYNPSRVELQINSLQNKLAESRICLDQVIAKNTVESNATKHRRILFENLPFLVTRIVNALAAGGAHAETIKEARAIQRKVRGGRASKKEEPETTPVEAVAAEDTSEMPDENTETTKSKQKSSSQQSFDLKLEHLARLVSLLENEPTYMPNEADLQLTSLQALLQDMRTANTLVMQATAEAEAARRQRKRVMYHKETGLVAIALQVKMYVKALFGTSASEYKDVQRISFRTIK